MTLEQLIELGLDEETAKKVLKAYKESIKDEYIPIARFNEVNEDKKELEEQIKQRDTQLSELKVKANGNEELTNKINELENLNNTTKEEYEEKIKTLRKETNIELALKDMKAKNVKAVKALLDLEKVSLDGENLIGLDEQLKTLKKEESYLFGEDSSRERESNLPGDKPIFTRPGGDKTNRPTGNPWDKDSFNLTKQGQILREDPELAAKLQNSAK